MSRKKEQPLRNKDKEIELKEDIKTDLTKAEKKGKKVRAVANVVFTEYSEVNEQDPGPDH